MKLIDKSALVAKIENRIKELQNLQEENEAKLDSIQKTAVLLCIDECKVILSLLDTLEVKEVDLEKETKKWWKEHLHLNPENELWMDAHQSIVFAKHFFELGLKVNKSLTWEDIANINEIVSEILKECGENILYNTQEDFCKEVLKRFKAQKVE